MHRSSHDKWGSSSMHPCGWYECKCTCPKDDRTAKIFDSIQTNNFIDISTKVLRKRNKPLAWTWRRFRDDERVQSACDYSLCGRKTQWKNFKVIDLPGYDTDHRSLKGKLISTLNHKGHRRCVKARQDHGVGLFGDQHIESIPPTPSDNLLK